MKVHKSHLVHTGRPREKKEKVNAWRKVVPNNLVRP